MITRFSEMINNWMGWCPNVQMLPNAPTTTTIPGAPVQGEPIGGGDAGSTREYRHWRRGRRSLVPAGLLIGLGVGLLVGYVLATGLIGLGLGFLGSAVVNTQQRTSDEDGSSSHKHGFGIAIVGIFFIIFGILIVWAPVLIWPYIGAAFLILLGIGILVHSFLHHDHGQWY